MHSIPQQHFSWQALAFVCVFIFSVFSKFSFSLGIYSFVFVIMFLVFLYFFNKYRWQIGFNFVPIIFFALCLLLSYFNADFKHNVRTELLLFFSAVFIYLLNGILNNFEKKSCLAAVLVIGIWLSLYLVTSKLSPAQFIFTEEQSKTLKSILCFLLAVFPLSFIFWNKEKKIYFFVSAGLFAALLISKNYLAAAISSTVFAVYIFTIRNSLKIKTSIAMIPLILTAAAELFFLFKTDFFLQIFKSWQNAFPVIKNNFLFGTGFGNYNSYADYFSAGVNGNFSGPKNIFLEILAGCGIFSFMFFTLIVVIFFVSIFKKIKNENNGHLIPILLSVCSFLIFSFFNNSFVSTNILLFFFLISYISPMISFELRTKKISSNAVIFLSIPLVFSLGLQLYARQSYKNGMFLLAKEKYLSAEQYFKTAGVCDPLDPNYYCKLADVYFEKYRTAKNEKFLDRAISLANEAVKLNKFDGRGYYQLAWLYKYKNFYREAVENIKIAMKYEPSNTVYIQAFKDIADPLFFERTFNEERELHVKVV